MTGQPVEARGRLGVLDAVMVIVSVVIGAGIFALPSMVAANTGSAGRFAFAWILGGVMSLAGALCYAELATAYPHSGGECHFLRKALGGGVGFLFAWSRMTIIQTGSIAIQAFIVGDYLSRILSLGERSSAIYAAVTVVIITAIHVAGIRQTRRAQVALGLATCLGVLLVAAAGLTAAPAATAAANAASAAPASFTPAFGLAMVFVLFAYGGWNEAAYVSADVTRTGMVRALFWGIAAITAIYLLVNYAYLRGLGLPGIAGAKALAAELVERSWGAQFAFITSLVIAIAALSTMSGTALTGGRSNYALGCDVPLFAALGKYDAVRDTPRNALLVQGAISLLLVALGAITRSGFVAIVEYTAPVFWLFFFLVGVSLFVLRRRDAALPRPFRVPLYPLTPLLFCLMCLYMLRSSLAYTGWGALVGVGVLAAGLPVLLVVARNRPPAAPVLSEEKIRL